nr:killer cell lectin-like receptor subfamily B member 1A isoform X2 [Anas platyrhynchos]
MTWTPNRKVIKQGRDGDDVVFVPSMCPVAGRWWYWVILGAGLLGATFLANIVLRLLQQHDGNSLNPTGSCSWESCLGKDTPSSNCSLNYFQLGLRERLCEAKSHQAPGAEGCWLCPAGWQPFATKCYWVSAKTLPWEEAGGDCKDRRAELVVLKSMEEKDFTGAMSKEIPGSWTGLSTIPTQGEEWTWMDGSPLQDDLLQVVGERRVNACAAISKGQLRSHLCSMPLHWICQKEATKI